MLLDIMLRSTNGFDILKQWKQEAYTRHVPIIIISAKSAEYDKVKGLNLGAEDYITKPFGLREFRARIDAALRRVTPEALHIDLGALQLLPDERKIFVDDEEIKLTQQEFELLLYIAPQGMLLPKELLKEVWGYAAEQIVPERLITIFLLRKKLNDNARTRL